MGASSVAKTRAFLLSLWAGTLFLLTSSPVARAQAPSLAAAPSMISVEDALRIALQYNQTLRAQRLNIDQSKANEITASLKPNPVLGNLVDTIPAFSPNTIRLQTQIYSESLSYTVERGGKREKRVVVAKDNTDVAAETVVDN
jgi:cobalt-zinc-cadmium efflux system outer membrane protein